jgi:nicotinate dehydrogenase subunit B
MRLSEALKKNFRSIRKSDQHELEPLQGSPDDKGFGGGSEAANAIVPPAVAAAVCDATGVQPRRIPLTPGLEKTLRKG